MVAMDFKEVFLMVENGRAGRNLLSSVSFRKLMLEQETWKLISLSASDLSSPN